MLNLERDKVSTFLEIEEAYKETAELMDVDLVRMLG